MLVYVEGAAKSTHAGAEGALGGPCNHIRIFMAIVAEVSVAPAVPFCYRATEFAFMLHELVAVNMARQYIMAGAAVADVRIRGIRIPIVVFLTVAKSSKIWFAALGARIILKFAQSETSFVAIVGAPICQLW